MEAPIAPNRDLRLLCRYTGIAMVLFLMIVAASLIWNVYTQRQSIQTMAKKEAISAFNRDEAFRQFIASRGGVYVPLDQRTPSNPYLNHPERDVTTTSGKRLTLMNGAYFFHKTMQEFGHLTDVKWRLASMKPVNPVNTPDEWEREALLAFQQGAEGMVDFNKIDGKPHVRSLSPIPTKEPCLKCHAYQGYKVGEIRGAMGVSLSMAPYLAQQKRITKYLTLTHSTFLLIGLTGLGFVSGRFRNRIFERMRSEEELHRYQTDLEEMVKERTSELNSEIREHKRSQEELKLFRGLIDQSNDAIFVIGTESARFLDVNEKALTSLGYDREELLGMRVIDIEAVIPDQFSWEEHIREVQKKGSMVLEGEHRRKDGSTFSVEVSTKIVEQTGETYMVAVARDLSERRRLESQLSQAQRLEAIGTLAGGIAHDFNNILGIIIGNAELAMGDVPESSPTNANLQQVRKASLRARDLVRQILTFSRQSKQEEEPLAMGTIIKEALKLLRSTLPTTIEIEQSIERDTGFIMADPTQIHQIIMNLSTNAAHAMGGNRGILSVGVSVANVDERRAEEAPDLKPGPYVKLTVSDTGYGMEPEIIDRAFEPYFTTKGVGEGTGLGLSVVHGIVQNHGGAIVVNSHPGHGTSFEVYFPRIDFGMDESEITESDGIPGGTERVLFVDDEPEMVRVCQSMLERLGYDVSTRTSSAEALETFRAQPDRYDLVITDQTMPHLTGQMLAKEMMAIRDDIPIILCTGHSNLIDEEGAKDMRIRAFVMKPIVMADLAATVRTVLDGEEHMTD